MFLLSELLQVSQDEPLIPLFMDAIGSVGAVLKASLAMEYERKGFPQRVDVWPATSAYRQDNMDFYVLSIEVKVPIRFAAGSLYNSVGETTEALKSLAENDLQTRRAALEAELKKVNTQMENL